MHNAKDRTLSARRLTPLVIPAPALIPLRPGLWFDPNTCAILRNGKPSLLTAREAALLTALLNAPRCLHSVTTLARLLTPPGTPEIDAHCVEQTIYGLRRKLGENGRHPRLLINRRDIGYGIFPQHITPAEQDHPQQPRQRKARKRSKNLSQT
jgi:DNA-binding winged helix-turn-helix (wHTH) protein